MNGKDVYRIWAPAGAKWTDWTRPVPFVAIHDGSTLGFAQIEEARIDYIDGFDAACAIILDLPDYGGIEEGLTLAKMGWRMIPLYNGSDPQRGVMSLADNKDIEAALVMGAEKLKHIDIAADAPPAFLLDTTRLQRYKMDVTMFDNSWDIYSQDMPSAAYLKEQGIARIIVRGARVEKDLARILYIYQNAGISIFFTDGFTKAKEVSVKKPLDD